VLSKLTQIYAYIVSGRSFAEEEWEEGRNIPLRKWLGMLKHKVTITFLNI